MSETTTTLRSGDIIKLSSDQTVWRQGHLRHGGHHALCGSKFLILDVDEVSPQGDGWKYCDLRITVLSSDGLGMLYTNKVDCIVIRKSNSSEEN